MPLNKRDVYLGRGLGAWAFWLHRLTGLAIVFYLFMHLLVIATVLGGTGSFNSVMAVLKAPAFLFGELLLIAAICIHGFNGVRIVLFDLGKGVKNQKEVFTALMIAALVPFLAAVLIAWPHFFA